MDHNLTYSNQIVRSYVLGQRFDLKTQTSLSIMLVLNLGIIVLNLIFDRVSLERVSFKQLLWRQIFFTIS